MFNEEKGSKRCIDTVIASINKLNSNIKLITVNDGSSDNTSEILKQASKKYKNLIVVSYKKNKGYGGALQEGIKKASEKKFDYALFMDSDLTNKPSDIKKFVDKLKANPDCVKASRYTYSGSMKNVPFKRVLISMIGNSIVSIMFGLGIKDCTNGFRMTKLSKIKGIKFHENSFAIILEELYYLKRRHSKVIEIPVTLTARTNTKSHFTYKPLTFYNYGKYAIKALFA